MMDEKEIPPIVSALAKQVDMTPIAWDVKPDTVTIVFEQGPKLTFQREPTSKTTISKMVAQVEEPELHKSEPVPAPSAAGTPLPAEGAVPAPEPKPKKKGK